MPRKPQGNSIYAVAEEAGVSITTVSRILNHRPGVSEELRRKVDVVLKRRQFSPNYPAPSRNIAVVVPGEAMSGGVSNYLARLLCGISLHSGQSEVTPCMIFYRPGEKRSLLEKLRQQQAGCALLVLPGFFRDHVAALAESGLPVITVDGRLDCEGFGYVDNDCADGIREAVGHLLGQGHTHIGYLVNRLEHSNHAERLACYCKAMRDAGLEPASVDIGPLETCGRIGEGVLRLLREHPLTTAVMVVGDHLAMKLLHVCRDLGVSVPSDLSVVGFDNDTDSEHYSPPLTTINHPVEEISQQAVMHACLLSDRDKRSEPPRLRLKTHLVVRESTAEPRAIATAICNYMERAIS